jgi:pilus assembly protein CpaC
VGSITRYLAVGAVVFALGSGGLCGPASAESAVPSGFAAAQGAASPRPTPAQDVAPPGPPAAPDSASYTNTRTYDLVVGAGKSQVLQLGAPYTDVMVADPKIADVVPLNTQSVYVVGKALGGTAITIYGPNRRLMAAVNVHVSADIESFKARLHEILPEETSIAVRPANQSLVLSGTVSSPAVLQQVMTLAETYSPGKVVNMLAVEGVQQVMLSVRFVEMDRNQAKNFRVNLQSTGSNVFHIMTGDTIVNSGTSTLADTFGHIAGLFRIGHLDLTVLFDALETKGVVKTLAEPNLTTMSGDTANFLVGGEYPVPVNSVPEGVGGAQYVTVEFKQFGIALAFTPTILKDGLINMEVNPEVSAIDPTLTVNIGGVTIPGLKVRRAHATVELRDGESFTLAGLLSDDYQNNIRQFPFIGDVPVLGALLRSTGYQKDQTELVIVVTPHLVTPRRGHVATPADNYVPPSDFELFLMGELRGKAENLSPEDRVLMSADPTKGGVEGPHGHVLY